jgi:hypothetical protein
MIKVLVYNGMNFLHLIAEYLGDEGNPSIPF